SRSFGGLPARSAKPTPLVQALAPGATTAASPSVTIPLRLQLEMGAPQAEDGRARAPASRSVPSRGTRRTPSTSSSDALDDEETESIEEGRPEDYANRDGYLADFFGDRGPELPLPEIESDSDVLTFGVNGSRQRVLAYEHFSVVMSRSRRLCYV